jgi:3-deoxy-7-phosphoheptulonate synthase/chorismate mutase
MKTIQELRQQIDQVNLQILQLLSQRGHLVQEAAEISLSDNSRFIDLRREQEMLELLIQNNPGPYSAEDITRIYKAIFSASLDLKISSTHLYSSRATQPYDTVIQIRDLTIGGHAASGAAPAIIAGPCSVESEAQMRLVAENLVKRGVRMLRGGAFKPRTSPYAFQGLGEEGLRILRDISLEYDLVTVSEILDPRHMELFAEYIDVLQIGARNMANFMLLREAGKSGKPVLLKRGFGATIEELIYASEYILSEGNSQVMLCERGIRTFEPLSRNTLDVTAIAILKQKTHLPVFADVSHAAGKRDLVVPLARASLAAGADGVMVEVHPDPARALSDREQQLSMADFDRFMQQMQTYLGTPAPTG